MKFKQKLAYMLIGCLFTIAGYILASPNGGAKHAQKDEQVIDKIVCRKLEVVNKEGTPVVGINTDVKGNGVISVRNAAGNEVVNISADFDDHGTIEVRNALEKKAVDIFVTENGGVLIVYNAAGDAIAGIVVNKAGDGLIESYKSDWRTR